MIFPIVLTAADEDNIRIWIIGSTTGGADDTVTGDSFLLIDNDQQTTTITLSYAGDPIKQDADPTDITVTATLDGATLTATARYTLLLDGNNPDAGDDAATRRAIRDQDYRATGAQYQL